MPDDKLLQPKELAKICGFKLSTLQGYLSDSEAFPPAHVDPDNNYRRYNDDAVDRLNLLKALRKRPYALKLNEAKAVLRELDASEMLGLYNSSNEALYNYLKEKRYL